MTARSRAEIPYVQFGLPLAADGAHLSHGLVGVLQNGARFIEKNAARFGQANRLRRGVRELHAELLFEIANLAA